MHHNYSIIVMNKLIKRGIYHGVNNLFDFVPKAATTVVVYVRDGYL